MGLCLLFVPAVFALPLQEEKGAVLREIGFESNPLQSTLQAIKATLEGPDDGLERNYQENYEEKEGVKCRKEALQELIAKAPVKVSCKLGQTPAPLQNLTFLHNPKHVSGVYDPKGRHKRLDDGRYDTAHQIQNCPFWNQADAKTICETRGGGLKDLRGHFADTTARPAEDSPMFLPFAYARQYGESKGTTAEIFDRHLDNNRLVWVDPVAISQKASPSPDGKTVWEVGQSLNFKNAGGAMSCQDPNDEHQTAGIVGYWISYEPKCEGVWAAVDRGTLFESDTESCWFNCAQNRRKVSDLEKGQTNLEKIQTKRSPYCSLSSVCMDDPDVDVMKEQPRVIKVDPTKNRHRRPDDFDLVALPLQYVKADIVDFPTIPQVDFLGAVDLGTFSPFEEHFQWNDKRAEESKEASLNKWPFRCQPFNTEENLKKTVTCTVGGPTRQKCKCKMEG